MAQRLRSDNHGSLKKGTESAYKVREVLVRGMEGPQKDQGRDSRSDQQLTRRVVKVIRGLGQREDGCPSFLLDFQLLSLSIA